MLSNAAGAVLGMVALGARSGYEIRRTTELSVRFFWALSPPQIYAELARLEEAGLIVGQDESQGRRPRRVYELTAAGQLALAAWSGAPRSAPLEIRDELLLRLFFADFAEAGTDEALLERIRDRSHQALETFSNDILPAARRVEERGHSSPRVAAEFGEALHRFIVGWCEEHLPE